MRASRSSSVAAGARCATSRRESDPGSMTQGEMASLRVVAHKFPADPGWIVGGTLESAPWMNGRAVRVFSIHCPAGERGYVRTIHEILDRLAPLAAGADLILGGDFNVVVGYRQPTESRTISRGE